ncbi:hypothetical protein [Fischerella sp. PCC 9605]|uniref:hypothetical protein n=1 Tax=Fischerella sp. PCC 9605 TaxID=1173024 RepID=UPI0012DBE159|nr:hypothetical protein [Fischerella sp. PCC 9605]
MRCYNRIQTYSEQRHFDSEDMRVMTGLADFAAVALLLSPRQAQNVQAVNVTGSWGC